MSVIFQKYTLHGEKGVGQSRGVFALNLYKCVEEKYIRDLLMITGRKEQKFISSFCLF